MYYNMFFIIFSFLAIIGYKGSSVSNIFPPKNTLRQQEGDYITNLKQKSGTLSNGATLNRVTAGFWHLLNVVFRVFMLFPWIRLLKLYINIWVTAVIKGLAVDHCLICLYIQYKEMMKYTEGFWQFLSTEKKTECRLGQSCWCNLSVFQSSAVFGD